MYLNDLSAWVFGLGTVRAPLVYRVLYLHQWSDSFQEV